MTLAGRPSRLVGPPGPGGTQSPAFAVEATSY